jgi:hypothetical protein
MQFSSSLCYFISLRSNHFSQHPVQEKKNVGHILENVVLTCDLYKLFLLVSETTSKNTKKTQNCYHILNKLNLYITFVQYNLYQYKSLFNVTLHILKQNMKCAHQKIPISTSKILIISTWNGLQQCCIISVLNSSTQ